MNFYISTEIDNGSGMKFRTKEELLYEISLMIDDCIENGGRYMDFLVDSDVSCYFHPTEEE